MMRLTPFSLNKMQQKCLLRMLKSLALALHNKMLTCTVHQFVKVPFYT